MAVTVIIPVLNERDNIPVLLPQVADVLREAGIQGEILIADGASADGTQEAVEAVKGIPGLRLLRSDGRAGLAGDVIRAARAARGDVVAVMDGDLSHPPTKLPELLWPVMDGQCDLAIGSRYVPGGSNPEWPWYRRVISRAGASLASLVTDVSDPMSGFFAVRRDRLAELGPEVRGFKVALELLARGGDSLRVREVPIEFTDRTEGNTKFGLKQGMQYGRQLARLTGGRFSLGSSARWTVVGLLGMGLDLGLFSLLNAQGLDVLLAHSVSFVAATILNFVLNWKWAFLPGDIEPSYLSYLVTCILAYLLRAGMIMQAIGGLGWSPQAALVAGILVGAIVNYVGSAWFVFGRRAGTGAASVRWRVLAVAVVAYSIAMRVLYGGAMDLIPEEAYYWNYSQHLAFGYLDHPPMVAWMIALGTWLLGDSELGVRLPVLFCWAASAILMWKYARLLFDRTTAFMSLALMACLPVLFLTGLLATPDAFLYLFWIAAVYFSHEALLLNRRKAWYALGILFGLGLLSKYTMALLGVSLVSFLLVDHQARKWWTRREPYLAAGLALLVFSPVILWNAQNSWVSFAFQSSALLAKSPEFGLFELLGAMLLLVTPMGLIGSVRGLLPSRWTGVQVHGPQRFARRAKLLAALSCVVPLTVFVAFSLFHSPKLNWTGVVFLAAIPYLARDITAGQAHAHPVVVWGRRAWRPTLVGLLLAMGFLGFYSSSGFPGLAPLDDMDAYGPSIWHELNLATENLRQQTGGYAGKPTVIVPMGKYYVSSELAFYGGRKTASGEPRIAGRGLFGEIFADGGLMWDYWVPREDLVGHPILLISFQRQGLERPWLEKYFTSLGELQREPVRREGKWILSFYWRIGYGYRGTPLPSMPQPQESHRPQEPSAGISLLGGPDSNPGRGVRRER
jgi:dolichol-phosphate mannosyltransferase